MVQGQSSTGFMLLPFQHETLKFYGNPSRVGWKEKLKVKFLWKTLLNVYSRKIPVFEHVRIWFEGCFHTSMENDIFWKISGWCGLNFT